eukprot:TRINITY_DN20442_c0_g1_i1.p1 TRINITY_DN20442_c0_g1~~TRINITY_DN20442_c0_g1_i1.p1  ORF type:complete len:353 (+),score=40.43 TRINITY_DN20442_c0_g1_i1:43-1059(+)
MGTLGWGDSQSSDVDMEQWEVLPEWERIQSVAKTLGATGPEGVEGRAGATEWENALIQSYKTAARGGQGQEPGGFFKQSDIFSEAPLVYHPHGHCNMVPLVLTDIPGFSIPKNHQKKQHTVRAARKPVKRPSSNSTTNFSAPAAKRPAALPVPSQAKNDFEITVVPISKIESGVSVSNTPPQQNAGSKTTGDIVDVDAYGGYRHSISTMRTRRAVAPPAASAAKVKKPPPPPPVYTEPTILCPVSAQTGCCLSFSRTDLQSLHSHLSSIHALDPATIPSTAEKALYEKITCPACAYSDSTLTPIAALASHLKLLHKYTLATARSTAEKPWKALGRLKK